MFHVANRSIMVWYKTHIICSVVDIFWCGVWLVEMTYSIHVVCEMTSNMPQYIDLNWLISDSDQSVAPISSYVFLKKFSIETIYNSTSATTRQVCRLMLFFSPPPCLASHLVWAFFFSLLHVLPPIWYGPFFFVFPSIFLSSSMSCLPYVCHRTLPRHEFVIPAYCTVTSCFLAICK